MRASIELNRKRDKDNMGNAMNVISIKVKTGPLSMITDKVILDTFDLLLAMDDAASDASAVEEGRQMFTLPPPDKQAPLNTIGGNPSATR